MSASQPVCGSDGKHYFTPCHAGCMGRSGSGQVIVDERLVSCFELT